MKPYFDDGAGIVLYCGDAREVLPRLEPDSVDLLLTDPPYGVAYESGWRENGHGLIAGDEDQLVGLAGIRAALPLLRRHRHAYIFGRWDLKDMLIRQPTELVWDKGSMSGGDVSQPWGKCHEYIQFAIKNEGQYDRERLGALSARLRKGSVVRFARLMSDRHPTEKPLLLLRELIESSSCIGETVLDPFAGVGGTLVAARIEGRKAIGIELEERHCETAARRLSQKTLDFCDPAPPLPAPTFDFEEARG